MRCEAAGLLHRQRPAKIAMNVINHYDDEVLKVVKTPSGLSPLNQYRLPGGASRLAALLIAHLYPISSLFAPCDPGAALRQSALIQRGQTTSSFIPCLPRRGMHRQGQFGA